MGRIQIVDCEGVGDKRVARVRWVWRTDCAAASMCAKGAAERTHEPRRQNCARSVIAENYSGVGSFGGTKAINGSPARSRPGSTTSYNAWSAPDSPLFDTTLWRVVNKIGRQRVQRSAPSARGAPSRAVAGNQPGRGLRLAASGDLPVRRLGGRVYVVTAGLRELAS